MMTSRKGGLSQPPYDSNNVGIYVGDPQAQANRLRLVEELHLPNHPLWLKQVHGLECVYAQGLSNETEADAVWTDIPGQVLAIQTADCLPVLFAERNGQAVAAAHAGWRGLAGGVLENTLAQMPVKPADVSCWLGAAIGPCCFEVGAEVRAAFIDQNPTDAIAFTEGTPGKWFADLYLLAKQRLHRAGVTQIYGDDQCASCDSERFFSYRRDKGVTGRMASLIWIRE